MFVFENYKNYESFRYYYFRTKNVWPSLPTRCSTKQTKQIDILNKSLVFHINNNNHQTKNINFSKGINNGCTHKTKSQR